MAESAVDLEVAGVDPGGREFAHHCRGDRERKEPVGAAQNVEDFRLDFGEILYRVIADRATPQAFGPPHRPTTTEHHNRKRTRHISPELCSKYT